VSRAATGLAALVLLLGCSAGEDAAPVPREAAATRAPALAPAQTAPQAADFPALASKDCAAVVEFYLEALGGHDWAKAALVWSDPAIDAARLQAIFEGYSELQLAWTEPAVEGAAGSSYCTVAGQLTDARDPARAMIEGTLLLKRVNDVPGATPDQLRWTLRSSTFVERLERSDGSEP